VHDIADLEARGVPGVFVATTEFQEAAAAQGRGLGFDPAAAFVTHPIQDRTDEEVRDLARDAFESILREICGG
jgi:alkanesulfonate monooxygenase SsuD/methylene tetrahydromethanopterin reductase-like flavin-dependent oxidoreductase (luciferase family)